MRSLEGKTITGKYYGQSFTGKVISSRMRSGYIMYYVDLSESLPIGIRGEIRNSIMIKHDWVESVMDNI
jgi:hypothetical protein